MLPRSARGPARSWYDQRARRLGYRVAATRPDLAARERTRPPMTTALQTIGLLVLSNLFMTYAWYGHLRTLADKPWWIAALLSWGS